MCIRDSAELVKSLRAQYDVPVEYHPADLTDLAQIEEMMSVTRETLGPCDIMCNNAGMQHVSTIEDFPPAAWDKVIALNLTAPFHTTRLALPDMRERGWGRIINIASVHGKVASTFKSAYVASKHGVVGLTKVTALETAEEINITCNAVCPGWVRTPLVEAQIAARAEANGSSILEEAEALLKEKQPSRQFVNTQDLGAMCEFLCSDAAAQITGQTMVMDGGWTAQ
eukprot:TRINITY_DN8193_c0_g1_i1.p1 TRINITY_DN8193_c0_g1~~TRINITY_DN8193_c0_g1_i1.p1  ORF type:complete len:226 (-),score=58.91 TRINITY_DN8193_c0_g1_i1:129-806(-)